MFSLIGAWIDGWVNNRDAGDLRRHRAHYGVIVMYIVTIPVRVMALLGFVILVILTQWGRDKMAAILRTTYSNVFLIKKNMNFDYDFTEDCSLGPNEQYSSIGLDNNLARGRRQAMIWTKVGYTSDAYMRHPTSIIFLIMTCPFPPKTIQQTCIDGVPKNLCYFFRRRIFRPNRGDMWRPGKFGNSISS